MTDPTPIIDRTEGQQVGTLFDQLMKLKNLPSEERDSTTVLYESTIRFHLGRHLEALDFHHVQ